MRVPASTIALALLLAAGGLAATPARADDTEIPGLRRTSPGIGRPAHENPEMAPFMTPQPRPAAAAQTESPPAEAPPAAAAAAPAVPPPTRDAALQDADRLLLQAMTEMAQHHLREAGAELEQARMALLNARAGGDTVPQQAISATEKAMNDLHHGKAMSAGRATETAEHVLAAAK